MKTIFIICTVRNAPIEYRQKLEAYAKSLEDQGYTVYLPHRDTDQDQRGFDICIQNADYIILSDEIHIFYNSKSQGTHFDMGGVFMFNMLVDMGIVRGKKKKIVVVENEAFDHREGPAFARMLHEWYQDTTPTPVYDVPQEVKICNDMYIISLVRLADEAYRQRLTDYALWLGTQGYLVHLPLRDTDQTQAVLAIHKQNAKVIICSREVYIDYCGKSTGIHFDIGGAFMFNRLLALGGGYMPITRKKKIVIVENEPLTEGKSYQNMLVEWVHEQEHPA